MDQPIKFRQYLQPRKAILSRLPTGMARSDSRDNLSSEIGRLEMNVSIMPLMESTNMARVMWQLPTSCRDLADRGLGAKDMLKILEKILRFKNFLGV